MDSSSSDEEFLASSKNRKSLSIQSDTDGDDEPPNLSRDSDDENSVIKCDKVDKDERAADAASEEDSDSDIRGSDEEKENIVRNDKRKRSDLHCSSDAGEDENKSSNSESSDNEDDAGKSKVKTKTTKQGKGSYCKKNEDSSKLLRLKKYLKVAGIKVQNYAKIFEGCKSKKSKETKLLELLESKGLKGKPTLERCKKLRKKIEREMEVAELDLGNIIDSKGVGSTSNTRTTRNRVRSRAYEDKQVTEPISKTKNIFGNLKGVIESDGSDEDRKESGHFQKKKKLKLIQSDEEN